MKARVAAIVSGGLLLGLGCSFPDIQFLDSTGATAAGGSTAVTGGSGAGTAGAGDGGQGGTSAGSAGQGGAGAVAGTGGTTTSGSGGSGGSGGSIVSGCDKDNDKHPAKDGICGGQDCDDNNPIVYDGEPDYYSAAKDGAMDFDYDCDNKSTLDPSLSVTVQCALKLSKASCEGQGEGYLGNTIPSCGQAADWGKCFWNGLGCVDQKINSTKMACK